jgi:hypothetical protein
MVANQEKTKKVPSSSDEWITKDKAILEGVLTSANVLPYVRGEDNPFAVVQNKENKIIELRNKAWSLVLDFIVGTPLFSLHARFAKTQDAPGLWKKICDHFENDNSQTRKTGLFQQLSNLEVDSSLVDNDRQLAFDELISRVDSYTRAYNELSGKKNQLAPSNKKTFLQNALTRSKKFADIATNVSLNDRRYNGYIKKVKEAIDFIKNHDQAINKVEHKQIQEKAEQTESTSAMVAQSEEEITDEDLKSLYAASKSNTRKLQNMLKKKNRENDENSGETMQNQNDARNSQHASHPQNSQFGGRGFHQNYQNGGFQNFSGGRGFQNHGRGRGFGRGRGRNGRAPRQYVYPDVYYPPVNYGYRGHYPHPPPPRPFPQYFQQQPPMTANFVEMPPPTLPPQVPSSFWSNVGDHY